MFNQLKLNTFFCFCVSISRVALLYTYLTFDLLNSLKQYTLNMILLGNRYLIEFTLM